VECGVKLSSIMRLPWWTHGRVFRCSAPHHNSGPKTGAFCLYQSRLSAAWTGHHDQVLGCLVDDVPVRLDLHTDSVYTEA
jgi:hypothetical protein